MAPTLSKVATAAKGGGELAHTGALGVCQVGDACEAVEAINAKASTNVQPAESPEVRP